MPRLFVAMPFADEFRPVYGSIRAAASHTGIEVVRIDEAMEPGPIISQITREIGDADFVIADVSSKNPNVYYEVGLAHCSRKPTVLLASESSLTDLPFDIRHNRVLAYERDRPASLEANLTKHLRFLLEHYRNRVLPPSREAYFSTLSDGRESEEATICSYIKLVAKEFDLQEARLLESRYSPQEGYVLTIEDAFRERVVFSVDINGLIRRKKRIT